MFDAAEWLRGVEEAARLAESERRWLDVQRMMAMRTGSPATHTVHTGFGDPMAAIDALMDSEPERTKNIEIAMAEVEDAKDVFRGMRQIGAMEHRAATMMELVHIGMLTKKEASEMLGISYSSGKVAYSYGVDWLDAHGIAYAKSGRGLAE